MLWSSSFTKPTTDLNSAIDKYNASPNSVNLGIVKELLAKPPRTHWVKQFQEINRLESEINREQANFGGNGADANLLGNRAQLDLSPTRWLQKLFADAPSLDGVVCEGDGLKGAQGTTFKLTVAGRKLIAKTDRSSDKGSAETECRREFKVYEKVYSTAGEHTNLVKVWGWADLKLGNQHAEGFIMDLIEGHSGRVAQKLLKDAWVLGVISSAEYWSAVQYIGRCLVKIVAFLRAAGWAHNDIKPENYIVSATNGEVIVIDLGGAAELGTPAKAITVEYAAPEMLRGGQANFSTPGTCRSDIYTVGATLAHATDAPNVFHGIAQPNQGIKVTENAFTQFGADQFGRDKVKNEFQYGAETAYTRQLKTMMASNPLERDKVLDEHASNRFLNDSILTDEQARDVLKGVVSGTLQDAWDKRWGNRPDKPTLLRNRLLVESDLKRAMRPHEKGGARAYEAIDETQAWAADLVKSRREELKAIAELISEANTFTINTKSYQAIVNTKLRYYDFVEQKINEHKKGKKP
jgi:serine/threonine protein kinase